MRIHLNELTLCIPTSAPKLANFTSHTVIWLFSQLTKGTNALFRPCFKLSGTDDELTTGSHSEWWRFSDLRLKCCRFRSESTFSDHQGPVTWVFVPASKVNAELLGKRFTEGCLASARWPMQQHHSVPADQLIVDPLVSKQQSTECILEKPQLDFCVVDQTLPQAMEVPRRKLPFPVHTSASAKQRQPGIANESCRESSCTLHL